MRHRKVVPCSQEPIINDQTQQPIAARILKRRLKTFL